MSQIVVVRQDIAGLAEADHYLDQSTAPVEWTGAFKLPEPSFHFLSVVYSEIVTDSAGSSPSVRGIPVPGPEVDGYIEIRWIFPGATASGVGVLGWFLAAFYRN